MDLPQVAKKEDQLAENSKLLAELESKRQRIIELERGEKKPDRNSEADLRPKRDELVADIEFIGDFDIVQAKGVNISSGGICFEIASPLSFDMKFNLQGKEYTRGAKLMWMKANTDGTFQLGLKFASSNIDVEF
jgi:hypothetical protein